MHTYSLAVKDMDRKERKLYRNYVTEENITETKSSIQKNKVKTACAKFNAKTKEKEKIDDVILRFGDKIIADMLSKQFNLPFFYKMVITLKVGDITLRFIR